MPPGSSDERTSLESWLDFYRDTLALKCDGLTEGGLRRPAVDPSPLTLLGLVQHMAEVERTWFQRVLTGEEVPALYSPSADPKGEDKGFRLFEDVSFEQAHATWQKQIDEARARCAGRALEETFPFRGDEFSLRWIYTHMIAEYARHVGHADFLRERIDGSTGF